MKNNTNFPYDVKVLAGNSIELKESEHTKQRYLYTLQVPEMVLHELKYKAVSSFLSLVAEINCSSTMYREIISTNNLSRMLVSIEKHLVYDTFTVDALIVFNQDTIWDDLPVKRGMPICHLGSFKIELDSRARGLITFLPNENEENVKYAFSDNTIRIYLPAEKYKWILSKKHNPLIKLILSAQFAQIALMDACQRMRDATSDHLLWQQELKYRWKSFSDNDKEFPDDHEIIPFIDHVLQNPSLSLISYLIENSNHDEQNNFN